MVDSDDVRWLTRRRFTIIAMLVVALGSMYWFVRKPIWTPIYERRMDRAYRRALANEQLPDEKPLISLYRDMTGIQRRINSYMDRYEYYRDILTSWGALEHREFIYEHIRNPTEASSRLLRMMHESFPGNIHQRMSYAPSLADQPVHIGVWARPTEMIEWERFFERTDVPDFLEKFGPNQPARSAQQRDG